MTEHDRDTRGFFDREADGYYASNYDRPRNRHEHTLSLRRDACLDLLQSVDGWILDLGCGPGAMTIPLVRRGHRVVASDISTAMVHEAARRMEEMGAPPDAVVANATALPFAAGTFAAVVTTGVLEYVKELPVALAEVHRILAPGGVLIGTMSLPRRLERAVVRVASRLLRRPPPVKQYIYGRAAFDTVVEGAGFHIEARRCSSFAPFPLDAIWPRGIVEIDHRLGPLLNQVDLACELAKTYIVRARRL